MQHNIKCREDERDLAGTHVLEGWLKDGCKIIQAAPFWEDAWPDFLLWDSPVFRKWKRTGVWDRWRSMQLSFVQSLERATAALSHPAYGMIGTNYGPSTRVVNSWLHNKVIQRIVIDKDTRRLGTTSLLNFCFVVTDSLADKKSSLEYMKQQLLVANL